MKFKLVIELGNSAMLDPGDVADALEKVASELRDDDFPEGDARIGDLNGNRVGHYSVSGRPSKRS